MRDTFSTAKKNEKEKKKIYIYKESLNPPYSLVPR